MKNLVKQSSENKVLNKTILGLGLVSFFADISSEMLYPITPIFLTTILGASMGSVGLVEGVAEAIASILKTFSGTWSDCVKQRKPFIIAGYFLSAVSKPLIGISSTWGGVFLGRTSDRMGKGIRSAPRDALLADAVLPQNRGFAYGWHRSMDSLGAAVGPIVAIIFLEYNTTNLRSIYYWSFFPGIVAVIILFFLKESKSTNKVEVGEKINFSLTTLPKNYKLFLVLWGVFSFFNFSDAFLIMKIKNEKIDLKLIILMYCWYNLIYSIFSPILGNLSDKISRKYILSLGICIFSVVYGFFAVAQDLWQFFLLLSIYGIYMAATDGVAKAFIIDLSGSHSKGSALGLFGTVSGISTLIGTVLAGLLWDGYGASIPFIVSSLGSILVSIFILFLRRSN